MLKDSSLQMRLITKEKICLYASAEYLRKHGEPKLVDELLNHRIISCMNSSHIHHEKWNFTYNNKQGSITFEPQFHCNDIDSALIACINGYGVGKFTDFNARIALQQQQLQPILTKYDFWFLPFVCNISSSARLTQTNSTLIRFYYGPSQIFLKITSCG